MQVIGLHIGSSFAEVSVWKFTDTNASPSRTASALFYLPRQNLKTALPRFLATLTEPFEAAFITTRFLERLADYRLGGSTAQLITAGLEAWPFLNAAASRNGWMNPQKSLPIASQELSFGIEERVSADGKLLTELNPESLAPIADKLQLMNIRRVCVHFLHASRNPRNQQLAAAWLKEKNFDVFLPPAEAPSENAAWRASTLEASFAGTFDELLQDIDKGLGELVPAERRYFHNGRGFTQGSSCSRVGSLFADDRLLTGLATQHAKNAWALDLGLESWRLFDASREGFWSSPWGEVAVRRPCRYDLQWQPTLSLEQTEDHDIGGGRRSEGYEPGPISFGRGQKPLVFDLFADDMASEPALREQMPEQARSRREGVLNALGRQTLKKDTTALSKILRERITGMIALETNIKDTNAPIILTGLFAPLFEKDLAAHWKKRPLKRDESSSADRAAWAGFKVLRDGGLS